MAVKSGGIDPLTLVIWGIMLIVFSLYLLYNFSLDLLYNPKIHRITINWLILDLGIIILILLTGIISILKGIRQANRSRVSNPDNLG